VEVRARLTQQKGLVKTFVNVCGNGDGEITYENFVKLLWQVPGQQLLQLQSDQS
jgi:Ca2+-binding EF-hand superfamily protein